MPFEKVVTPEAPKPEEDPAEGKQYKNPYGVERDGTIEFIDPKKPLKKMLEERDLNAEK